MKFAGVLCIAVACISALLAAGGAQTYAPATLTAAEILEKATAARGKLEPGAYVEVVHRRSGGLDSTIVSHSNGADELATNTTGRLTSAWGKYRGQSWWQDANGTVLLTTNFHGSDPNVLAWLHPEDPASRVSVLGVTTDAPPRYVLEANPAGGSDQYRYYDVATMQLVREVTFAKDRHKHVSDFDDFRTVFGRTWAFHSHYSDGRPDNDSDVWTQSFERDASPVSLAIPNSRPLYAMPSAPVVLPASFSLAGIVVHATIGGRDAAFLLDTGSSSITLDPDVAQSLGVASFGKSTGTIGGEVDFSDALVPRLDVGALQLQNVAVDVMRMSRRIDGTRIVGLLGCDFLAANVVGIDLPKKTVTIYPRGAFDPATVGATGQGAIEVDDCVPRLAGSVESVPGTFIVDTGSFTSMLYKNYLDKLPSKSPAFTRLSSFGAVGGEVPATVYDIADLGFGPILFRHAEMVVPTVSTFDVRNYDGIIGRNVLNECAIFLDYADRTIYFKPELP